MKVLMNNELEVVAKQRVDWIVSSERLWDTKGKYENIQYSEERLLVRLLLAARLALNSSRLQTQSSALLLCNLLPLPFSACWLHLQPSKVGCNNSRCQFQTQHNNIQRKMALQEGQTFSRSPQTSPLCRFGWNYVTTGYLNQSLARGVRTP